MVLSFGVIPKITGGSRVIAPFNVLAALIPCYPSDTSSIHHTDTKVNTDYFFGLKIDTDAFSFYLHELFYQIHKFIENLNLSIWIRTKYVKQKCVQCID